MVEFGYPLLDTLITQGNQKIKDAEAGKSIENGLLILIAPSWGSEGIIESGLCLKLIHQLISLGHRVIIRPHPQTFKFNSEKIIEIQNAFSSNANVKLEVDVQGHESLLSSDLMISDWSGVALEYALGINKPVIFCDVPKKINNPEYLEIDLVPLEISIRNEIGVIWDTISPIEEAIIKCKNKDDRSKLDLPIKKYVYNAGRTDVAFINFLKSLNLI